MSFVFIMVVAKIRGGGKLQLKCSLNIVIAFALTLLHRSDRFVPKDLVAGAKH